MSIGTAIITTSTPIVHPFTLDPVAQTGRANQPQAAPHAQPGSRSPVACNHCNPPKRPPQPPFEDAAATPSLCGLAEERTRVRILGIVES